MVLTPTSPHIHDAVSTDLQTVYRREKFDLKLHWIVAYAQGLSLKGPKFCPKWDSGRSESLPKKKYTKKSIFIQ